MPFIQEAERGRPGRHSKFQDNQDDIDRTYLKTAKTVVHCVQQTQSQATFYRELPGAGPVFQGQHTGEGTVLRWHRYSQCPLPSSSRVLLRSGEVGKDVPLLSFTLQTSHLSSTSRPEAGVPAEDKIRGNAGSLSTISGHYWIPGHWSLFLQGSPVMVTGTRGRGL